ncbi:MAG TPA: hypothetical protein VNI36_12040 [Candidatus Dormibacteraeota bacterium]|nr:hypothetical protein [Candidatus Dormibacteraeota bacterium]
MARHMPPIVTEIAILLLAASMIYLSRWFFRKGWPRRIALFGFFLPVIIGLFVRHSLQNMGKPVMSWDWILPWFYRPNQMVILLLALAYLDIPFLLVAAIAGKLPLARIRNRTLVYGALFGTLLFTIMVFGYLWRNTEAVILILPIIPIYVLPGTLLGLAIGWTIARFQHDPPPPKPHTG